MKKLNKINYLLLLLLIFNILINQNLCAAKKTINAMNLAKPILPIETANGVLFTFQNKNAKSIAVAGSFNNWDSQQYLLKKNKYNVWYITIPLPKGIVEYKFIINNQQWTNDLINTNKAMDSFNGAKSIFEIKEGVKLGSISVNGNKVNFIYYNPDAEKVALVGTFNDWDANANLMVKNKDNYWTIQIELIPGTYYYKFVINDIEWKADPSNENKMDDGYGRMNSVLEIQ